LNVFDFIYPKRCLGCEQKLEERLLCCLCENLFSLSLDPPGVEWALENSILIQKIYQNPLACQEWLTSLLLLCLSHAKFQDVEVLLVDKKGPLWNPSKNVAKIFGWKVEQSRCSLWSQLKQKHLSSKVYLLVEVGEEKGALDLRNIPRKLYYFSLFLQKQRQAKSYL
jgi:hypothetical protein